MSLTSNVTEKILLSIQHLTSKNGYQILRRKSMKRILETSMFKIAFSAIYCCSLNLEGKNLKLKQGILTLDQREVNFSLLLIIYICSVLSIIKVMLQSSMTVREKSVYSMIILKNLCLIIDKPIFIRVFVPPFRLYA